jgi:hypothetical protein
MAFHSRRSGQGWQISSRVLPARTALDALGQSIGTAASLAGVTLPPPVLELQETNWLVGVRQRLSLDLDLGPLDPLPSLALSLEITPPGSAVRLRSAPLTAAVLLRDGRRPARVVWSLLAGERNHLVLTCWRWSPLGLGSLLVVLTLLLTLLLQRIRMTLGFGPPQLPA